MVRKIGLLFLLILILLVAMPAMAQDSTSLSQPVLSLDLGDIISILFGLGALVLGIIAAIRSGAKFDANATAEFDRRRADREWMERNERAYQLASEERKEMLRMITPVLGFLANLSPWKWDNAGVNMLKDIQQPGPDPTLTPAGTTSDTGNAQSAPPPQQMNVTVNTVSAAPVEAAGQPG